MRIQPTLALLATALPADHGDSGTPRPTAGPMSTRPVGDPAQASREAIEQAVVKANRQMSVVAPALQFEIDPDLGQVIVRLVDRQNQNVLRQVPSPEMLAIARALDRMEALLVRVRA